jgi:phosphoribosyl-ATP pyrophosphohydrolase
MRRSDLQPCAVTARSVSTTHPDALRLSPLGATGMVTRPTSSTSAAARGMVPSFFLILNTATERWARIVFTLDDLAENIARRAGASPEKSYTRSLLDKGAAHCARKFGEEAIELAIAAAAGNESAVRGEAADVLYHLLVLLRARGIALSSVMNELESRTERSGHEERASRGA